MRVAVTGATGFIGRHVVAELLRRRHSVVASALSEDEASKLPWFGQAEFEGMDLHGEFGDPFELLGRPDVVIHLAWEGLPNYQQLFHLEENLFHQYRFLRASLSGGLRHLVVAGTCLEYGLQNGCLAEDTSTAATTAYGLAKDLLRRMLEQLGKVHPFVLQWVRVFYPYGDGQHPNSLLPQLSRALERGDPEFPMSGGEQLRDYLAVTEVARRFVRIAEQTEVTGVINCCSGSPISVRRLVEEYLNRSGRSIRLRLGVYPYPDFEPMAYWGDLRKWHQIESNTDVEQVQSSISARDS
jgi:dTDP-6-deoxy-L-talose 4-dehydrogenase (NAD+)